MGKYNKNNKRLRIEDFQHPADKRAVEAVKAIPGFTKMLEFISKNSLERSVALVNNSSYLKVTPEMSPKIHEMLAEAVEMYNCPKTPEIFLRRDYNFCIELGGINDVHIFLPTTWLELTDDDMLFAILSCQIASIQAKQETMTFIIRLLNLVRNIQFTETYAMYEAIMINTTMSASQTSTTASPGKVTPNVKNSILSILPSGLDLALTLALRDWERNSIYTADRAILLASESFELAAKHILFGDAPMESLDKLELSKPGNAYYQQAKEFLQQGGLTGLYQKGKTVTTSAQWTASRYMELYNWYFSGEYHDVLERSLPDEL